MTHPPAAPNAAAPGRSFAHAVGWNAAASIAVALQGVAVVPILTRTLAKSEYGQWALFTTLLSFAGALLRLGADTGLARFVPAARSDRERGAVAGSIAAIPLALALVAGALVVVASGALASLAHVPRGMLVLLGIGIPIEVAMWLTFGYLRGARHFRAFALFRILVAAAFPVFALAVAFSAPRLEFFAVSYLASEVLSLLALAATLRDVRTGFHFDPIRAREFLRFSLPLVPNVLLYWVIESSDRYLISVFRSLPEVAEYSLAYTLGASLAMVWSPLGLLILPQASHLWSAGRREDVARLLRRLVQAALVLCIGAAAGLTGLAPQLVLLLSTPAYLTGSLVVGLVTVAYVCYILANAYQYVAYLQGDTRAISIAFAVSALVNIGLNVALLPTFGIMGAAASTLASYFVFAALLRRHAARTVEIGGELGVILRCAPATAALLAWLWWLPLPDLWKVAVGIPTGLALYLGLAGAFRAISLRDLRELSALMNASA